MSTLQISLAIIGGLVLAGVVAYNAWVTRNSAPRTASERPQDGAATGLSENGTAGAEPAPHDPRGVRIDPVLGDAFDVSTVEPSLSPGVATHSASAGAPAALSPVGSLSDRRALDALIDVITPMQLDAEVSGDAVLAALPGTRRVGSKPFAVEGLGELSAEWESPRPGQRYRALQAGVQLANRSGPLNDIEFSEFVVKTQAFADTVGATPDFPDMRAEVSRARELDAFASGHDAQLGFTLRARRAAWSPGYVTQQAALQGFVAGSLPGRLVLPGRQNGQAPILSLSYDPQAAMAEEPEQSALREIVLSLEVTHVARSENPFVHMRQVAAALALSMDGVVTDDAGQPLADATMDRIDQDLQGLYQALDARDLSAGSPQARRLFS
jgi:hypothetical protein